MPVPIRQEPKEGLVTVIVLNYNGARWLERCLHSVQSQTIFERLEIIVADNASPDRSDLMAADLTKGWPNCRVIQHGRNLGFCEGNNRAAELASGKYLLFLNNDTWLERDCIEQLVTGVEAMGAQAGEPLIIDYEDDSVLCPVGEGFDIFGMLSIGKPGIISREIFVVGGCSYLIRRDLFERLGGFDSKFYMYADEFDLSWRVWVAGGVSVLVTKARLHHRSAANVNPEGGSRIMEQRTSDTKRFYTNRNGLLLLLKNCQHVLLLMVPLQLLILTLEGLVAMVLIRRWNFIKRAYLDAVCACWHLRSHILSERRRIAGFRQRTDWEMLRFLCFRPNRWDELLNVLSRGLPKVSPK